MKISAKNCLNPNSPYRPYSVLGAIWSAIESVPVYGSIEVESLEDATGMELDLSRLATGVNKVKGDRVFHVRKSANGVGVVYRVK